LVYAFFKILLSAPLFDGWKANANRTVKQVLCENGQAVEYGQALYVIE
jgi:hypothetical protein